MRSPDAFVTITLLEAERGGRVGPLLPPYFNCVVQVDSENLSVRLGVEEPMRLGTKRRLPAYFLSPDLARPLLKPGVSFKLWDGHVVGTGLVETFGDIVR